MNELSIALKNFNEKVRIMNQTNGKTLVLTPQEARSLHVDIFSLLANIAELSAKEGKDSEVVQVVMDGGGFR